MKILIYDSLFVKGHIHPNMHYIDLLSTAYDVSVVSTCGYFHDLPDNVELIDIKTSLSLNEIRGNRINQVKFTKTLFEAIKNVHFDYALLLSYDLVSFAMARLFFPKEIKIVLQEHNNIDNLTNRYKRAFFNLYKNKVSHIVYEDFMKDALVNLYGVNHGNVVVLPRARFAYEVYPTEKKSLAIGLSGSNSDEYIEQIITETNNAPNLINGRNIVLKAHNVSGHNENIRIVTNRVSDEEYQELFNSTRIVLDPLPSTFMYRMSAVMFEGLSSRKIVIGSDAKIIQHFSKKYPHICKAASNPKNMIELALMVSPQETDEERQEFEQFNRDYSDNATAEIFSHIFLNK